MRIISVSALRKFWEDNPDAEQPLRAWNQNAEQSEWKSSADIKESYQNASIIANSRVVFNIRGNNYRLVVKIHYNTGLVYIRFVGTHKEYDAIDAETV